MLGNFDTGHVIKISDGYKQIVGLSTKRCGPQHAAPLSEEDREIQRKKVPGWRLLAGPKLSQDWHVQSAQAGAELLARVQALAQSEGHALSGSEYVDAVRLVRVDLGGGPASAGGLTENDFILASKAGRLSFSLLEPRTPNSHLLFWRAGARGEIWQGRQAIDEPTRWPLFFWANIASPTNPHAAPPVASRRQCADLTLPRHVRTQINDLDVKDLLKKRERRATF